MGGDSEVVDEAGVGVASSLKEAVTGITPIDWETRVKAEVAVEATLDEVTEHPKSSDIDIKSPLDGPFVPKNFNAKNCI